VTRVTEVRPERATDADAVRAVLVDAFGGSLEADLVEALRRRGEIVLGLVAELEGRVVGYVAFSPVEVDPAPAQRLAAVGLAPLGVAREHQRRGVGERLVWAGLETCRRRGEHAAVVLGDPGYYGRFGFTSAERRGLGCEYDAPPGAFQVLELVDGALDGVRGLVRYSEAFRSV
jgi:putative acetyltransferase